MSGATDHQGATAAADNTQQGQHQALDSIQQTVAERTETPASNPGSDDGTGGIALGSGGKSSTAHKGSPVSGDADGETSTTDKASISTQINQVVSTFASALGLGGSAGGDDKGPPQAEVADGGAASRDNENDNSSSSHNTKTAAAKAYDYVAAGGAAVAGTAATAAAFVTGRNDQTSVPPTRTNPATSSSHSSTVSNTDNLSDHKNASDPSPSSTSSYTAQASRIVDSAVDNVKKAITGTATNTTEISTEIPTETPTETPNTTSQKDTMGDTNTSSSEEAKDLRPTGKAPAAGVEGGKRGVENPSAIPTAGGERLGEKHWGESKPVPDLPPVQNENPSVASSDGQPTKEVSDNTAKNTGGATGGPGHATATTSTDGKPTVLDKVKGALNIGKA